MNEYEIIEINNFAFDPGLVKGWQKISKYLFAEDEDDSETFEQLQIFYDGAITTVHDEDDLILSWLRQNLRRKKVNREEIMSGENRKIQMEEIDTSEEPIVSEQEEYVNSEEPEFINSEEGTTSTNSWDELKNNN
jgi:hypothetical protein